MKKYLLFLLLFSSISYAYIYDSLLLTTQASIFPKLIILDKNLSDKLIDSSIVLSIVYEKEDYLVAEKIKKIIIKKFNSKLGKYTFKVILTPYDTLSQETRANAFYLLHTSQDFSKIFKITSLQHAILFSYDIADLTLSKGSLLTIVNENKTTIYLNKNMLKSYQIEFVDIFYQIVKFI